MFHKEENNAGALLLSFLIGGIVGAGAAILFTPYSGKKMRGKIADMADDAVDYANDYAKKVKQKLS